MQTHRNDQLDSRFTSNAVMLADALQNLAIQNEMSPNNPVMVDVAVGFDEPLEPLAVCFSITMATEDFFQFCEALYYAAIRGESK